MLRYYEELGFIKSMRQESNSYRFYDEAAIRRLQQIIILRKLQIPVKQICGILDNPEAAAVIDIFKQNIYELENEITALSTIKSILENFVSEIEELTAAYVNLELLNGNSVKKLTESLSLVQKNTKEKLNMSMNELNQANENLAKLQEKHIRIIYLPPATVASIHSVGGDPEDDSDNIMGDFMIDVNLFKINPGARFYGFNHDVDGQHGYEVWGTIPDDLEVPAPLTKKQFAGGLYAAYTSKSPVNFNDWRMIHEWVNKNEDFEHDKQREPSGMSGCLEEHFNSYNLYELKNRKHILSHIDFLIPVKETRSE
jgi:DNA-binding transcriptional MerR regulator